MKKLIICCAALLALTASAWAAGPIQLPAPAKSGGAPLLDCLAARHASRNFADVALTEQQLSDLLWAAAGVNREDGRFTYPTALNIQDITVYAVMASGAYRYDPKANTLTEVAAGDHRAVAGMQPFVAEAAVNLVYVQDTAAWEKLPHKSPAEKILIFGSVHAGEIAQNVGLYAASVGWDNVVRGSFPEEELPKVLGLPASSRVLLAQSVGPAKE